jgi:beta-phosphoglucomutase-like phosphatase (HAD superfamily)
MAPAEIEVAVVGAGAAGLAAAAELRAQERSVVVLEARDRVGGRTCTDSATLRVPFDLGASYIHACEQGNPWADIALALGEPVVPDRRRRVLAQGGGLTPAADGAAAYAAAANRAWPLIADAVAGGCAGGLKIGSTTGYTREIMEPLFPLAAAQGYAPDCLVCAGDLPKGRPTPLMMYKCFLDLAVWPASAVVKVDDTAPGIAEGVAARSWAVGVAMTGNAVGLGEDELETRGAAERQRLRIVATEALREAGAHRVVDGVADLVPVLDEIEARLARGERPS